MPRDRWHDKTCAQCRKPFRSKRSDARHCSTRCTQQLHYSRHRDVIVARCSEWNRANKQARYLISSRYKTGRRMREGHYPGHISLRDWTRLVNRFGGACAYCGTQGTDLQMDHVVPLSRAGSHGIGNILPACGSCNMRKNGRLLVEWRKSPGSPHRMRAAPSPSAQYRRSVSAFPLPVSTTRNHLPPS